MFLSISHIVILSNLSLPLLQTSCTYDMIFMSRVFYVVCQFFVIQIRYLDKKTPYINKTLL